MRTETEITTRKRFNKILSEESQAIKVLSALETGIHRHYDYSVASKKDGFKNLFNRVMIPQFIRDRQITDAKYSQFNYRLKVIHKHLVLSGYDDEVLFSVGLIQKAKKTRDTVYLYSPEVLEMVYAMIRRDNAKRKSRKAAKIELENSTETKPQ